MNDITKKLNKLVKNRKNQVVNFEKSSAKKYGRRKSDETPDYYPPSLDT